jgi:hypothetical protein
VRGHGSWAPTRPLSVRDEPRRRRGAGCANLRLQTGRYVSALSTVVERAGVAYGYTLTIWSAGALCIRRFGLPDTPRVVLFAAGGTLGYVPLALWASKWNQRTHQRLGSQDLPARAGLLWENVVVLPALGVTLGVSVLLPVAAFAFLVVPVVATLAYLVALTAAVALQAKGGMPPTRSN